MRDMGMWFEDILKNSISVTKLRHLMDDTPQIIGYDRGRNFVYVQGNVTIDRVTYGYVEGKHIFENFSLVLK